EIDLIVRGICCLRPQVPGVSDRIRVVSIVDRYLEHARAFSFDNAGQPEVLLASADWMPRNLDHRIEIAFPLVDPALSQQVREFRDRQLTDTVKTRVVGRDGRSQRVGRDGRPVVRAQDRAYELIEPHPALAEAPLSPPAVEPSANGPSARPVVTPAHEEARQ